MSCERVYVFLIHRSLVNPEGNKDILIFFLRIPVVVEFPLVGTQPRPALPRQKESVEGETAKRVSRSDVTIQKSRAVPILSILAFFCCFDVEHEDEQRSQLVFVDAVSAGHRFFLTS